MPEQGSTDPSGERPASAHTPGIGARAAAMAGSFLDYIDARIRLLGVEAREARGAVFRRIVAAIIGTFFLLISYLALLISGVAITAKSLDKPWYLIAIAAGAGHILIGGFFLLYAKRQLSRNPFRDSRREFEKDREWLNSMRPPKS